jgi:hypothetical protein
MFLLASNDSSLRAAEKLEHNLCEIEIYVNHVQKCLDELEAKFPNLQQPYKRRKILNLLKEVRLKELENRGKYQVLHAQDSLFFAYQVIAKHLYEALILGYNKEEVPNFEFLRYPHPDLLKNTDEFFQKFPGLIRNMKVADQSLDANPEISLQLLSVSFSMEYYVPVDSALFIFVWGKGISEWSSAKTEEIYKEKFKLHLKELFESAGIASHAYEAFLDLLIERAPKTDEGIINQIIFPKEKVGDYLYLAKPLGFLDQGPNEKIDIVLEEFQQNRLKTGDDFDHRMNLQARFIAGSLFNKDITIYRYSLIPEDVQEEYEKIVEETIHRILSTAL